MTILATGSRPDDRQPLFARNDEHGNRFYTWGDPPESFWSVTTIIGGGVPKHLVSWAVKLVAELVYEDLTARGPHSRSTAAIRRWAKAGRLYVEERQAAGELKSIKVAKLTPQELALRYLKSEPERVRDAAAKRGSDVHAEAEAIVLEKAREASRLALAGEDLPEWPESIAAYMKAFAAWVNRWRPEFLAAEATVFHRAQAYAGTLDAIVAIPKAELLARLTDAPAWLNVASLPDPVTTIVDYKSGRQVYRDVALQLAAYARGEFIGGADRQTEIPVPPVDLAAVLHLTPTGPIFRPVRVDEVIWQSFLYAREVFRWAIEISKDVLGPELVDVEQEVA